MLNNQQKKILKAEETFRYEVRKELQKQEKKSLRVKIWEGLNSSFGLWVLSTVLVGAIVSIYTTYDTNQKQKIYNEEIQRKIEIEISGRLQFFKAQLECINTVDVTERDYLKFLAIYLDGSNPTGHGQFNYIFPEFEERTTQSLLFELEKSYKEDKNKQEKIKRARIIIKDMKNYLFSVSNIESLNENDLIKFKKKLLYYVNEKLESNLYLKEWSK